MQIEELRVRIMADMSSLRKALESVKGQMKDLDNRVRDTEKRYDSMNNSAADGIKGMTQATSEYKKQLENITQAARDFINANKDIGKSIQSSWDPKEAFNIDVSKSQDELKMWENTIQTIYQEIEGLQQKIDGGDWTSEELPQLMGQLAELYGSLSTAETEADKLKAILQFTGIGTKTSKDIEDQKTKYYELAKAIEEAKGQLANTVAEKGWDSDEAQQQIEAIGKLKAEYKQLGAIISEAVNKANQSPNVSAWDTFKSKLEASKKVLKGFGAKFKTLAEGVGTVTKKFGQFTVATGKAMVKLSGIPTMIKKVNKSLTTLWSKIKTAFIFSAINSWFRNIREDIEGYLNINTPLQQALSYNKGAWLTAFQPLYEVVVPALTKFINLLTTAVYKLAQFTSLLNGKSVSANQDSAKALYATADAAEAAGDSAKEAQKYLAGFDELNVMSDNSSSSSGSSSSDNGALFGEVPDLTEYTSWSDAFGQLLDRLIALLPKFNELMGQAAEKINYFSENLLEMFTADGIQEKVSTLSEGLANGFNKLITDIDWYQLGQAAGAGIQTVINFVKTAIETFDWKNLGSSLASGINGIFNQINFSDLGKLVTDGFNLVWQTVSGFTATLDWAGIGKKIAEFLMSGIQNIDFASVGSSLSNTVKGLLTTLTSFLENADWKQIGKTIVSKIVELFNNIDWAGIVQALSKFAFTLIKSLGELIAGAFSGIYDYFKDKVEESGGSIVGGIFKGIVDALKDIGSWIIDNIFTPFIDGFKDAFGINSPSTVMAEQGGYIIDGLLKGLTDSWSKISEWFGDILDDIKTWCSDTWDDIKSTAKDKWDKIKKTISDTAENVKTTVTTKWTTLKTNVSDLTEKLKTNISNRWAETKTSVSDTVSTLKEDVETKWGEWKENLSTKTTELKDNVSTLWDETKTNVSDKVSALKDDVETKWSEWKDNLTSKTENLKTDVSDKWENLKTNLSTTTENIKTTVGSKFDLLKTNLATTINNIKSGQTSSWSDIKSSLTNTAESIKSTVGSKWDTLKSNLSTKTSAISSSMTSTFTNMKSSIVNIFDGLKTAIKAPLNGIIGFVNKMLAGIKNGINDIVNKANTLSWTVPDWVPKIGGSKFGFNLKTMTGYEIPYLAKGGVIDSPTLAMVGEYAGASNNPEIVTPQNLMKETMSESNDDLIDVLIQLNRQLISAIGGIDMEVKIGDDTIANSVKRSNNKSLRMTGKSLLA